MTELTRTERAIVAYLVAAGGRVVPAAEVVTGALGYAAPGFAPERTLAAHMSNLRRKGVEIRTWRGRGFYVGDIVVPEPPGRGVVRCWCGAEYEARTSRGQRTRWTGCEEHRGEEYARAAAELAAWRARRAMR